MANFIVKFLFEAPIEDLVCKLELSGFKWKFQSGQSKCLNSDCQFNTLISSINKVQTFQHPQPQLEGLAPGVANTSFVGVYPTVSYNHNWWIKIFI